MTKSQSRQIDLKQRLKSSISPETLEQLRRGRERLGLRRVRPYRLSAPEKAIAQAKFRDIEWGRSESRIVYALTPDRNLANIGDHAQVVAIRRWLMKHYPGRQIIELDKNVCIAFANEIAERLTRDELVFLHSGGNLGDRALWSETARRAVITACVKQRVISLPQTIHFSDTRYGRRQRELTRIIYGRHPHLTIMARDRRSEELARDLFPGAQVLGVPDFVLSLDSSLGGRNVTLPESGAVLACLRRDSESAFSESQREQLVARLGDRVKRFDTTLSTPLIEDQREAVVADTLDLFSSHDAVVTDRYHGLIFAVLARRPVRVLPTVDHKLTSAMDWFDGLEWVEFCDDIDKLDHTGLKFGSVGTTKDFSALYFDNLPLLLEGFTGTAVEPVEPPVESRALRVMLRSLRRQVRRIPGMPRLLGEELKSAERLRLSELSEDELKSLMRHDAHRIEKSIYNDIFDDKRQYYEMRRDNVVRVAEELVKRGAFRDEPWEWAERIVGAFDSLERDFIRPGSTAPEHVDRISFETFASATRTRRSSRVWASVQPTASELIDWARSFVEVARWAPNSGDRQAWRFAIVEEADLKSLLKGLKEEHCYAAPCLIVVGADRRLYGALGKGEAGLYVDAGAALMQMMLAAHQANFGVCWNHFSRDLIDSRRTNRDIYQRFAEAIGLPDYFEPVGIMAFGVAEFHPPTPARMAVNDLLIGSTGRVEGSQ